MFPRQAINTTLTDAQNAMPFPVILPPTDVFPLRRILMTQDPPPGPEVQFFLGDMFSGSGFWVRECGRRLSFGPNPQFVELAEYPATVKQWVNQSGLPLVLASVYNGLATYTVLGSHVELSEAESMLVAILVQAKR